MDVPEVAGGPLRKALAVLEALAGASRPLTLSELSRLVGQPKSTLHRTMRVLTDLRLAIRRESKYYEVGDYLFQMAATSGAARAQNLSYPITPFLIELFQLTHKIVSVGMLSGTNVHHVGTLYRQEHARLAMALRHPFPAQSSAAGRLLIAKSTRLSWARSEYIPGLVEVAAPVHLGKASPVAAIVVADTANNMDLRSVGRVLLRTVGAIEQNLAGAC